ncbi:hypothetical protein F3Y22_tig00110785pilonHSYRG00069 [Hibiscus syriacus]|uniref:Uncharacterized protein n=1 Tax=Hibiscus syriacus TaxID=106335 RepID=A0A6A2ZSU4_HIBSY|nr:uncharacterized protein LOC120140515 [Hibiscus syriacus]KAE8694232.1 hypothetical protein F3Y22_tig00110785pilonHSYRG00069 [Hibiscus syriacus]
MKEWSLDSPEHRSTSPKQRLSLGFVVSFMALCAKHAGRVSKKLKPKPKDQFGLRSDYPRFFASPKSPLKSPRPKQLLATLSNKAIKFVHRKRHGEGNGRDAEAEEIGDGGVWQRGILMGDKCQPLDFSGVIYYDSKGNQVEELPFRSPRASPMPAYLSSKNGLIR